MELDKAIQFRKSVRKFTSKKPDWREIVEAIDSVRYAPCAGKNFTLKFILVDDQEKILKISHACQQDFVATAHYVVVAVSKPERLINSFGKENGEKYCRQQAGAGIQNFLLKLTEIGYATCWVGHFVEKLIKEELKIPDDCNVEAIFPIGFELEKTKPREKIDLEDYLYFEKYGNKRFRKENKIED
jgi:nitroreductase